jgi:hypothetical protein
MRALALMRRVSAVKPSLRLLSRSTMAPLQKTNGKLLAAMLGSTPDQPRGFFLLAVAVAAAAVVDHHRSRR